jgi:hypothetical protein
MELFRAKVETRTPEALYVAPVDDPAVPRLELDPGISLGQLQHLFYNAVDHSVVKQCLKHGRFSELAARARLPDETEVERRAANDFRCAKRRALLLNLLTIFAQGT